MMELLKLVLIIELLLAHVFCQEMDVNAWTDAIEENKWPNSAVIQDVLVRLSRRPAPRRHLGRKDSAKSQMARKRHKFRTFVGLMGKRSPEDEGAP